MRKEINWYIKTWEARCYSDGLPDEAPKEIDDMVPSYRRIAMAILKNDLKYIGIQPVQSDYYGLLKSIELQTTYIKSKRMTQSELRDFTFKLINTCISKQCYIKGYGTLFRVCDLEHNPVMNITKQQFDMLTYNGVFIRNGLVYSLNVIANPFGHPIDIKLPPKE
jgi:hypothetical protein